MRIIKKRRNFIHGILNENQIWITGEDDLTNTLKKLFSKQSISNQTNLQDFIDLDLPKLEQDNIDVLLSDIKEEEIWAVVKSIGSDKAPGPDGLNEHFYQNLWVFVK